MDWVEKYPERHSISVSILLHILPGIANASFAYIFLTFFWTASLPSALVIHSLANLFVLFPIQLGCLFYLAKKRGNRGFSLEGIVIYMQSLSWAKYIIWVLAILLPTALVFSLFDPVSLRIESKFTWITISSRSAYEGEFSKGLLLFVFGLNAFFTALLVPITEELYFRGYLLPRMPREFGNAGPAIHSFLFAIYHFDSPWMIPVRTLGLLPLIYVTKRIRSVGPGIVSHCIVNLFDVIERAILRFG